MISAFVFPLSAFGVPVSPAALPTFLAPWWVPAAAGLAAIPPLVLLYFLKLRREQKAVASTLLWRSALARKSESLLGIKIARRWRTSGRLTALATQLPLFPRRRMPTRSSFEFITIARQIRE